MDQVASKIVARMMMANLISEKDAEEYIYGVQILLEKIISYSIIFLLALILNRLLEVFLFVISFSLIRKYSGGIHCKRFETCLIASAAVSFSGIALFPLVENRILLYQGGLIMSIIIVIIIGAINNPNIDWSICEYRKAKRLSRLTVLLESIFRGIIVKKRLISMICVMLVGLTACQAAEDKNKSESSVVNNISTTEADNENESKADLNFANQNERVVNTFPSSYSKTINNCKFEIGSINSPNEVVFYNGTASASTIDCKGIVEYYFNGREYVILEQTNEVFVLNSNGDVEFGASLNGIGFVSCFSYYQNSVRYLPEDQNNNLSAYTTKRDFSFGTAEECYGKISDIYSKYGMNIKDNVKVITYYLDHETLAREEMVLDHNGIDNKTKHKPGGWMEDDDAYMFFITQECQGLPDLNWEGWFWEGVFNPLGDAGILIIYNKDGFVKVEPRRVIVDYTYKDETMRLLSFDDIVANVAEHLNGIISNSSTYTISEARLYVAYDKVTESEFRELELHWGFLVTQKDDAGVKVFEVYINAQTGEYESH